MVKLDIWMDKLPEDKAKYYNRTRMSMELFAQKLGISPQKILEDFWRNGYLYDKEERQIKPAPSPQIRLLRFKKTLHT